MQKSCQSCCFFFFPPFFFHLPCFAIRFWLFFLGRNDAREGGYRLCRCSPATAAFPCCLLCMRVQPQVTFTLRLNTNCTQRIRLYYSPVCWVTGAITPPQCVLSQKNHRVPRIRLTNAAGSSIVASHTVAGFVQRVEREFKSWFDLWYCTLHLQVQYEFELHVEYHRPTSTGQNHQKFIPRYGSRLYRFNNCCGSAFRHNFFCVTFNSLWNCSFGTLIVFVHVHHSTRRCSLDTRYRGIWTVVPPSTTTYYVAKTVKLSLHLEMMSIMSSGSGRPPPPPPLPSQTHDTYSQRLLKSTQANAGRDLSIFHWN